MPNWVYTRIAVKGTKEQVLKFINDGLRNTTLLTAFLRSRKNGENGQVTRHSS